MYLTQTILLQHKLFIPV